MTLRVLVTGGRDYADEAKMTQTLERLCKACDVAERTVCVIHGGAKGADRLAGRWAERVGADLIVFSAAWKKYGRKAGPIRNQRMLEEGKPDIVVAFPGGNGTADMVNRAKLAGVPVHHVGAA